ncbi:NAD(P)-dependent oxidoreductase [Streptomyces sp. NPDC020192]|uniref:NAD(P)-dependent oxidoreductase n=1 Tax=Streptomyces sp. NPDC020192 TaxID=3365066 RepID=UPI00378EB577
MLTATDAEPENSTPQLALRWHPYTPLQPDTLSHAIPATHLEILLDHKEQVADAAADLTGWLRTALRRFHPDELDQITATMPLLAQFTPTTSVLADWAVIFRDHYVENTLGFLLALQHAGVPTQWIYALAKGDRTHNRDRVHATLLDLGCASGLLDNTAINAPDTHATELAAALHQVDAFIDAAHEAGRKVLVIDDGGLLAQGYGRADAPRRIDAALELTVSGLKRITATGELGIPVLNLARSQLKTRLGYPEIADSCLRRLRALLPAIKVTGRPAVVIGYGTLGSRLAQALRHQGCQIHVVDPDPLALIAAAEAGHATYRTTADALRAVHPFLIVGTTGDDALTVDDLQLLPDGAYLAPFATRDFSVLADPDRGLPATEIPGIGRRYRLSGGGQVTLLGDGRSMNLFEADAIPNQGYDAYRAGTLIAADALCRRADNLTPGIHTDLVDDIILNSGLYSAYYDTYLATEQQPSPRAVTRQSATTASLAGMSACVVGYGAAGRLHAQILAEHGASLTIVDPKHQDLPKAYRGFPNGLEEMPAAVRSTIGLWSVCCPTADHLPVLRTILAKEPEARILLEKPACQGHEIDAFTALLASHNNARFVVTDQYQHARALDVLTNLMARLEPGTEPDYVAVTFTKDRTGDVAQGRFVDRSYGVLGYEWLHMLAVLRRILPAEAAAAYLAQQPQHAELWATYDPRLFVSALTERTNLTYGATRLRIELTSSIATPTVVLGSTPRTATSGTGPWRQGLRPADDRHRRVTVHAGRTQFTVHLDPVTATGGWQLERNHHRVTAERDGLMLHDEVVHDSPLHTAIRNATTTLMGTCSVPEPDLGPLRRIAALAELLRAQQPTGLAEQTSA